MLVGVEHRVGILAGAFVDHALHVGVVLGEDCRDLADHVGHVRVQAGNTARGARLAHGAARIVHGVRDIAVLQIVLQFRDGHIGTVGLGFLGAGARVCGDEGVGHEHGLGRGEIRREPREPALMEGGVDGILVNDGLTCEVDEHRAGSASWSVPIMPTVSALLGTWRVR